MMNARQRDRAVRPLGFDGRQRSALAGRFGMFQDLDRATHADIVRPDKASMFGRSQSCRERNQTPVAWMAAARETETVEAHRQSRSWNGERATGPQRK